MISNDLEAFLLILPYIILLAGMLYFAGAIYICAKEGV